MVSRREWLRITAGAGAALSGPLAAAVKKKPMKILILGGTSFLGPQIVEAACARGHVLSLFNRGKTNPGLFPDIEKLRGDRDGDLKSLEGRAWDAVGAWGRWRPGRRGGSRPCQRGRW